MTIKRRKFVSRLVACASAILSVGASGHADDMVRRVLDVQRQLPQADYERTAEFKSPRPGLVSAGKDKKQGSPWGNWSNWGNWNKASD